MLSKMILFAALLLGLRACAPTTARYHIQLPTDTQLSCDELWEARRQVALTGIDAYQNGHSESVLDLNLRLRWLKGLYKGKGCLEEERLGCLRLDSFSRQLTGYSVEEYLSIYGVPPDMDYSVLERCRKVTGN